MFGEHKLNSMHKRSHTSNSLYINKYVFIVCIHHNKADILLTISSVIVVHLHLQTLLLYIQSNKTR